MDKTSSEDDSGTEEPGGAVSGVMGCGRCRSLCKLEDDARNSLAKPSHPSGHNREHRPHE
jgi:hypothetical protein